MHLRRSARLLLMVVPVLALAISGIAQADIVVGGGGIDTTPPALVSVDSVSATQVDVTNHDAQVDIMVSATDNLAGVSAIYLQLRNTTTNQSRIFSTSTLVNGTRLNGTFKVPVTFLAHSDVAGTYVLTGCAVRDTVDNWSTGTTLTFAPCPENNLSFTVVNTAYDHQAPVLVSVDSVSATQVDVTDHDAQVDIMVSATDNLAGVSAIYLQLRNTTTNQSRIFSTSTLVNGTRLNGTFKVPVTFLAHSDVAGTYVLTGCAVRDTVDNWSTGTTLTFAPCPENNLSFTVVDNAVDTTRPVLRSVDSVAPTAVDVTYADAQVDIIVSASDDLGGVSAIYVQLLNLTTNQSRIFSTSTLVTGTRRNGAFKVPVTFLAHSASAAGTYRITGCAVRDTVDNWSTGTTLTFAPCPGDPPDLVVDDRSVDLTTQLITTTAQAAPRDEITLSARVRSSGPSTPVDPKITIPVPAGTTLSSVPPSCTRSGAGPVVCPVPAADLGPGKSVSREIQVVVASNATGSITVTGTASSSSEERTPADNTATLSIPIVAPDVPDEPDPTDPPSGAPAKLSLTNAVSPTEALPGDMVTYTLTATNGAGGGDATGTVVTDVLPAGVRFLDASSGCTNTAGTVRCELGTVAAGTSEAATIRATVDPIPMKSDPNTAHQILETKAETDLRVEHGETRTATASCPGGYLATDGGIRLDAVDQGGDVGHTSVPASGPTADGSGWTATLRNDNPGAALAKVTVACLARTTVTGTHQHDLVTTTATAPAQPLAAGSTTLTVACPAGQTPFAPLYALSGGGTVTTSKETGSGWSFVVDSPAAGTGDFGVACLGARTTTAAGHFHALGIDHRAQSITVPAGQTIETQLTCADQAKGIVASRRLDPGLVDRGTDPRAKIRSFRFTNPTDHTLSADLGLTCVDIRTSGEPVAQRITNTATVATSAIDATTADDTASSTFTAYGDGWAILPTTTATVGGSARSASIGLDVRCASDCVVSARLVALGKVRGTSLRAGSILASGRTSLAAGGGRLTVRATGTAASALTSRKVVRAKVVITTSDGATTTKTITLRR